MSLIYAHNLDPLRKLGSFRKWDKGIDINPDDETSYTAQFPQAVLNYVENGDCVKHRHVPVNKHESLLRSNDIPSRMVSESCQLSFDLYDSSCDDDAY